MRRTHKGLVGLCLILLPLPTAAPGRAPSPTVTPVKKTETCSEWKPCKFTTYANHFEGRKTASGARFSHQSRYVACRTGAFRTIVRFRYRSDNGNWHESRGILADRGGLPLHRKDCPQYDVPKLVARELGLYRRGGNPRVGEYQYVQEAVEP